MPLTHVAADFWRFLFPPDPIPHTPEEAQMQTFTVRKGILIVPDTRKMTPAQDLEWYDRWPDFPPSELDSDDWSLKISVKALDALQRIRTRLGVPLRVTNAYRNPRHNKRVGGTPNSSHLKGLAFDIAVPTKTLGRKIVKMAIEEGFTGIGQYPNRGFLHIDMRAPKANGGGYRWSGGGGSW